MVEIIRYKKLDTRIPDIIRIDKGNWVDIHASDIRSVPNDKAMIKNVLGKSRKEVVLQDIDKKIHFSAGDILVIRLGFAMELPKNYEAHIVQRSSTFINSGLILTNSIGIIDKTYCGNDDEWKAVCYCTRTGDISVMDRLFQFQIIEKMRQFNFVEVEDLGNKARGGFGSTGEGILDVK